MDFMWKESKREKSGIYFRDSCASPNPPSTLWAYTILESRRSCTVEQEVQ